MKLNPVGSLARYYSEQPIVQALAQLVPGVGPIDTLLKTRAQEIAEDRARVFFEELENDQVEFTPELIHSEDFVHRFVITAKAAANTRRREKIRLFARMFTSSFQDANAVETDVYEEYLSILDDLSYREIYVLNTLERHEAAHPVKVGENELQRCCHYWESFTSEVRTHFGISDDEIKGILSRLNRTGCYTTFTGGYTDYEGDQGRLTDIYFKLKRLLGEQSG